MIFDYILNRKVGFELKLLIMLLEKIKQIYKDIHQMKKVSELINYIPMQSIERAAAVLLIIWVLSPIIIMFSYNSTEGVERSLLLIFRHIFWYGILQTIGFLGCILNVVVFSKSIIKAKIEKMSIKQYIKNNLFFVFLCLMLIWSIFSCIASENVNISFNGTSYRKEGIITYFTYCGILGCGYVIRNKQVIKRILEIFTLSATILSILMLINSKALNEFLGFSVRSTVFLQFNHFGYYLGMSIMSSLFLIQIDMKSPKKLISHLVIFAVITAALIGNESLGPYLAVVAGLICSISLIIWLDKSFLKRTLIAVGVFAMVTITMNIHNSHLYKDIWTLKGDITKIVKETSDVDKAGTGRWILWRNGVRFISEKPLFGYGPDNLGEQYAKVKIRTDRPHNEIIQFAASLGIPAAIFYIMAMINYFRIFLKYRKRVSIIEIGMLCIVVAYLASSMFGNTMYYTSPFFFMLLGISSGRQKLLDSKTAI